MIDLVQETYFHGMINPRSFYEQRLSEKSLSIGYSSTAIHWLSKKPCNIVDHCYPSFSMDLEN